MRKSLYPAVGNRNVAKAQTYEVAATRAQCGKYYNQ